MTITIRPIRDDEHGACERILRALPDWFGIENALLDYVRDTQRLPTQLAHVGDEAVGFVTVRRHFPRAAEIHCMAVLPEHHRAGIGRAMVQFIEHDLTRQGVRFLQVKTLGPSRPCEYYERTRRFYEAMDFTPLEELKDLWPGNPCLIFVKTLPPPIGADARSAG